MVESGFLRACVMNLLRIQNEKTIRYLYITLAIVLLTGCGTRLQKATASLIEEAEAQWKKESISNYKIVVDVQMNGEIRRNEIMVQDNNVRRATVSYKDNKGWVRTQDLNESQALAFTVPGLFETVREELRVHARSDIRVAINPDRGHIERIVFGPVLQKNEPIQNSEVYIFVRKFEPITKSHA